MIRILYLLDIISSFLNDAGDGNNGEVCEVLNLYP